MLLADSERVLRRLHRLKDLGVQIAIDDFGTGYSSLSYLQRVPFDILKIDRAFVAALRHEDPQTTLVRTIMDLGRTLGRTAIAEGIEEQVELDGLLALGCELGQGHALRQRRRRRPRSSATSTWCRALGLVVRSPAGSQPHFGASWNSGCGRRLELGSASVISARACAWSASV